MKVYKTQLPSISNTSNLAIKLNDLNRIISVINAEKANNVKYHDIIRSNNLQNGTQSGCQSVFRSFLSHKNIILTIPGNIKNYDRIYLYKIAEYLGLEKVKINYEFGTELASIGYGIKSKIGQKWEMHFMFIFIRQAMMFNKSYGNPYTVWKSLTNHMKNKYEFHDALVLSLYQKNRPSFYSDTYNAGVIFDKLNGLDSTINFPILFKSKNEFKIRMQDGTLQAYMKVKRLISCRVPQVKQKAIMEALVEGNYLTIYNILKTI